MTRVTVRVTLTVIIRVRGGIDLAQVSAQPIQGALSLSGPQHSNVSNIRRW